MPANSRSFNLIFAILGLLSPLITSVHAQSPGLTEQHRQWIADHIFANECNSEINCLTSWNPGENFPSLGIGHFIWYQQGQNEIYTESFPQLLDFYEKQGVTLPAWLNKLPQPDSPWVNRDQFYADFDQPRILELRQFLQQTMSIQTAFIMQRQQAALPKLLANSPPSKRQDIELLYQAIAASDMPYGMYALIDYVNFKGEGTDSSERYQGQGWGLLQVLQHMQENKRAGPIMPQFAEAAVAVLTRRVANAPVDRNEQRWLQGWINRVSTYVPPPP